jgi:site-specific recombinase XerD
MAPRFSVDRYRHLASAVHARQWLIMREQIGLSPNTLDAYARAIDSYYFFLESHEHTCETSNQRDVASWISELRARGLANATLIQRVTALRLFFEYLVEEGLRPGNPVSRAGGHKFRWDRSWPFGPQMDVERESTTFSNESEFKKPIVTKG